MNSEIYLVYQGMRARQRALDVTANNIANASTTGFKAERMLYRSVEAAQLEAQQGARQLASGSANSSAAQFAANQLSNGAAQSVNTRTALESQLMKEINVMTGGATDFSAGSLHSTGRSLDAALIGDGFFAVQTPRGERYTRAGSFTLDASGQLVTQSGDLVIGQSGGITVPPGEVSIGSDGTISVNNRTVDQLKIVRFPEPKVMLLKEGSALFAANEGVRPREDNQSRVAQGSLELSNVNTLAEMAAMIQNGREFESLQRSISMMMNDLGRKVASELGRI